MRTPLGRRGAVAVETAFVLGLCLTFMLAIFDFGRMFMARNLLQNAAREGARQAVVNTATLSTANIQTIVTNYLAGQQFNSTVPPVIQVYPTDSSGNLISGANWTNTSFGKGIAIQIDVDYQPAVPTFGILPTPVHIRVKSIMQSEAN